MIIINEFTKDQLILRSRTASKLNRYDNRVTVSRIKLNRIKSYSGPDGYDLDMEFVTNDRHITIVRFIDFMRKIEKRLLSFDRYETEFNQDLPDSKRSEIRKKIKKEIRYTLDNTDISVYCDCEDFIYRQSYTASLLGFGIGVENRPSNKTNPNYENGVCKHLVKIFTNTSVWIDRLVTEVYKMLDYDKMFGELLNSD